MAPVDLMHISNYVITQLLLQFSHKDSTRSTRGQLTAKIKAQRCFTLCLQVSENESSC